MNLILQITSLVVLIAELALAGLIFFEDRKNLTHRVAAIRSASAGLYALIVLGFQQAMTADAANFWLHARGIPMILLTVLTFHLAWHWSRRDRKSPPAFPLLRVVDGAGVLTALLAVIVNPWGAPLLSESMVWTTAGMDSGALSLLARLLVILLLGAIIAVVVPYLVKIKDAEIKARQQVIALGLAFPPLVNILLLLPGIAPGASWAGLIPLVYLLGDLFVIRGLVNAQPFRLSPAMASSEIIDIISDGLVLLDPAGKIRFFNSAFQRLCGLPPEDLENRNFNDLFLEGGVLTPFDLKTIQKEGSLKKAEKRLQSRGRGFVSVWRSATLIRDASNRPTGILLSLYDLSEMEKERRARAESERQYQRLFQDVPLAIIVEDLSDVKSALTRLRQQGITDFQEYMEKHPHFLEECVHRIRVLDVNKQALNMMNARKIDDYTNGLGPVIRDDAMEMFHRELQMVWEENIDFELEGVNYAFSGERKDVIIHYSVIPGHERKLDRVLVLITDITARKQAEHERDRLFEEVNQLATLDFLTGLYNRRRFIELAQAELERAYRYKHPLSLMILDIDGFKKINDNFGHSIGDQAMQNIAGVIRATFRKIDILCRYGGDEFVILLPEIGVEDARKAADRLRQQFAITKLRTDSGALSVTASVGIAEIDETQPGLDMLLTRADAALRYSKKNGRNHASAYAPGMVTGSLAPNN